ncbi:hypothetical protein H312_02126 [Anncaliia algerae PRA339]|uniref:Fork-head domain-containing protein n=1 Tax=Anncaliia algerae PRA339 TaxID=1288291 RepID=A0A059EZN1_9MICR|nr:hypothetical protein H312_02126 [Anncaliia algerae PRA339]
MEEKDIVTALLKLKNSEEQKTICARLVSDEESIDICTFYYRHIYFDLTFSMNDNCWFIFTKTKMIINEAEVLGGSKLTLKNNSFLSYYEEEPLMEEKFKKYYLPKKKLKIYNFKFFNVKHLKSYKQIITEALSKHGSMSLNELYKYFEIYYNFSVSDSITWKNSIRHNLSINKEFIKVSDEKGSQWTLNRDLYSEVTLKNIYNPINRPISRNINTNEKNIQNYSNNLGNKENEAIKNNKYSMPPMFYKENSKIYSEPNSPAKIYKPNPSMINNFVNEPIHRKTYFDHKEYSHKNYPPEGKRLKLINDANSYNYPKNDHPTERRTKITTLENETNSIIFEISESTDYNEYKELSEENSDESSSILWKSRRNRRNRK